LKASIGDGFMLHLNPSMKEPIVQQQSMMDLFQWIYVNGLILFTSNGCWLSQILIKRTSKMEMEMALLVMDCAYMDLCQWIYVVTQKMNVG
jgi:hypothetical protein